MERRSLTSVREPESPAPAADLHVRLQAWCRLLPTLCPSLHSLALLATALHRACQLCTEIVCAGSSSTALTAALPQPVSRACLVCQPARPVPSYPLADSPRTCPFQLLLIFFHHLIVRMHVIVILALKAVVALVHPALEVGRKSRVVRISPRCDTRAYSCPGAAVACMAEQGGAASGLAT